MLPMNHKLRLRSGSLIAALLLLLSTAMVGGERLAREVYAEDGPAPAPAGEPEASPAAKPSPALEPTVALVTGNNVNLRVGPRVSGKPVLRMQEGTVLLIVERVPGWFGVRVPAGFEGAVAERYVKLVGTDAVRIEARSLNLRLQPRAEGKPMPAAFRDQLEHGAVLALIDRANGWARVWAPETVRAYVSADYVKELGPPTEHMAVLKAARKRRTARIEAQAEARREAAARVSGAKLRASIGSAQQTLYKLRMRGGFDRAPVVTAINGLEASIDACRASPAAVRKLAHAIRQDLESELEIRMARKDAEVARLRGLDPPAEKPPAPKIADVKVQGEIRWEPAPRWRNGGAWVLWAGEDPRYVLHLTTGLPHPLPDLKGNAGQGLRTIRGRQSGERVFGLPVIEVRSISK